MQITKRNLKFLIESMLNEEDPRFSAARGRIRDEEEFDRRERERAREKEELEAAREEERLSVQQEVAVDEFVEEELNITAQWFNTVVFPALEKDPKNMNIVIDYPYLIGDSKIIREASLGDLPVLNMLTKMQMGHTYGARYVATLEVGSRIDAMDSKLQVETINFNEYVNQPMSWWDNLSSIAPGNRRLLTKLFNKVGPGKLYTLSNAYEAFEAVADASGLDVMTTFKGVKGGGLF